MLSPPPTPGPVIHNFRNKAVVEHDNEYHIKRKLCITEGGEAASYHLIKMRKLKN